MKTCKIIITRAFRPDLTTIVVIGNVSPENAVAVISKYFGDWTGDGDKAEHAVSARADNAVSVTHVPDASRVQDKVTLAETLQLTRTNADYYALQLGNHVLGGGFYATRLYRDLREKSGLVYFVDSSFHRRTDARRLSGGIRLRPAECFQGAGDDFARPQTNAKRKKSRRRNCIRPS